MFWLAPLLPVLALPSAADLLMECVPIPLLEYPRHQGQFSKYSSPAAAMAANGPPFRRVMTDNAFAYRLSRDFQDALAQLGAKHILIKPHHPWQNGKAARFNRTLREGWAYRPPSTSNQARIEALHG
jgi:hypothetical protein